MISSEQSVDIQKFIKDSIENAIRPLVEHIKSLDNRLEAFKKEMAEMKQSLQCLENALSITEGKVTQTQKKLGKMEGRQRTLDGQISMLQTGEAQTVLRFQNISECEEENLKEEMSVLLAPTSANDKKRISK